MNKPTSSFLYNCLVIVASLMLPAKLAMAAPEASNLLLNSNFERPTASTVPNEVGLPQGWGFYQWGPENSTRFISTREVGAGRNGSAAVRAESIDASARPGIYQQVKLASGTYELSVWARAAKGQTAGVRIYLAKAYSRIFSVGDEWKQFRFVYTLSEPIEKAEINIQNATGRSGSVWFDDATLCAVPGSTFTLVPDIRTERPRTLLFSPININYLKDTAPDWAKRGFRGFMFDKVMEGLTSDVWAVDGDATTRGRDDKLLQELKASNDACRRVGIDSNFVKVAIYEETPDPFDDAAWTKISQNLREGARFSRMANCAGMAIDTEYFSMQFDPGWEGYRKNPHPLPELKAKIRQRWAHAISGMLEEFPQMVLLVLPEGIHHYGELYQDLFNGMLRGMAKTGAPGGIHVLTEGTYHITDVAGLHNYMQNVEMGIEDAVLPELLPYWKQHGTIAIGAWPFGYYRAIFDKDNKIIGYAGKAELTGDKLIGSYSDKSAWYGPEEFATQMAGLNSFSPRYNWIYGHGDVFTHLTPEQKAHYDSFIHKSNNSVLVPIAPHQDQYFKSIVNPQLAKREVMPPQQVGE